MTNKYIVSTCDHTHNGWKEHWDNFSEELIWLYHTEKDKISIDNTIMYTEKDLRREMSFNTDVSKKHYWNSQGNRNIIWFYPHLRMLYYYKLYPTYDYYYFFDDDVTCDDWQGFIKGLNTSTSDFLAWFTFQKEDYTGHLPTIDKDTTSQHMWFERFPGHNDKLPKGIEQYYGSFFPVVKASNKAMEILYNQLNKGMYGYSEGFVPTVLNFNGCNLESLYNKDNTSNLYDINQINVKHKHSYIRWNWI